VTSYIIAHSDADDSTIDDIVISVDEDFIGTCDNHFGCLIMQRLIFLVVVVFLILDDAKCNVMENNNIVW